jgi:hypothetical protein
MVKVDVLSSGGQGRPTAGLVRRPRKRRLPRPPRSALAAAGVLVAAAAVLVLRAAADSIVPAAPDLVPMGQSWHRPAGPFDQLSGGTPMPEATVAVDRVGGELPPTDRPDDAAALQAVQLVLGRYCLRPDGYELTLTPLDGWLSLGTLAVRWDRGDRSLIDISLIWTGRSYRWAGIPDQLRRC